MMSSLVTHQPFKAVYALLAITYEAWRLPIWILIYAFPSGRPHPKWTTGQAIMVHIIKAFLDHTSYVKIKTPLSLEPGSLKDRFVVLPPASPSTYIGPAEDAKEGKIAPQKIGGTWYPSAYKRSEASPRTEDVILHFHGGAYAIGDGRPADAGFVAKTLLAHSGAHRIFAPQYRLASNPEGRYPAAFQDAVTSYAYLVRTLGIPANRITISGDSAGGNLALALLRYVEEYGETVGLPRPGCCWLWSPWVDVATAKIPQNLLDSPHYHSDYLAKGFGAWGANLFAPEPEVDDKDPYVSPLGHPFKTSTPVFVQTGTAEVLYPDDVKIAEDLKKVDGNVVELFEVNGAPHDILLVGDKIRFVEEAKVAAGRAGDFLRANRRE
ncbi:alpha/beta-hydrolase [Aulographum hederae CBS 113979]|uniref:Alpha/beta-hydrolase n=1 Tax=Aulographum hederae CBS 113979 TaxID=1176131 RepID=A0A6G1GMH6_9PEZI|nr:alpha/beta-hydrolase [Aulographum hederae CBS 113979]